MGIVRTEESKRMEIEELRRMLVDCGGLHRRKDDEEFKGLRASSKAIGDIEEEEKVVCVTSGFSFLGLAIVNQLLLRGYSVRIIVDNPEDVEKLREMEISGEMRTNNNMVSPITAKLTEIDGLLEAFEGCRGVFHTSSFVDPSGLSGYTKFMGDLEVKATENVMEACARTRSVRKCVLTSSLLACIWLDNSHGEFSQVVNHECWSDELLCTGKKLWYALAKLRAEKAAWRIAEEMGLKLATICPGLITGPDFCTRNSTATIAYLKGAQEMYENGLLAAVDVFKLAKAHVCVFEAMRENAFGRYICFDHIVKTEDEAEKLAREIGLPANKICPNPPNNSPIQFPLSNRKLADLMSAIVRCNHRPQ